MSKTLLSSVLATLISFNALATNCPQFYLSGKEPAFKIPAQIDQELCYSSFAVGYHYATKSAYYSAQHMTKAVLLAGKQMDRVDNFHEEDRLPVMARATLNDFRGSGFDRGHLTANKDEGDRQGQFDSFSLANMVPQLHINNAGIWEKTEESVRKMALAEGEAYVITGGIYAGSTQKIKGGIPVPNAMYKAVYLPGQQIAGAYVSNNDASGSYQIISINELTKIVGFDVFPALPASLKSSAGDLLKPNASAHNSYGGHQKSKVWKALFQ